MNECNVNSISRLIDLKDFNRRILKEIKFNKKTVCPSLNNNKK